MRRAAEHEPLRVARPTDRLEEVVCFYSRGLGLTVLGSFQAHDGFDGVMLGRPGAGHHLEFTYNRGHRVGRAPTQDNLLVFYLPDPQRWRRAIARMRRAGYEPVPSFNPYWDLSRRTFEDPDGYRVVLQNASWPQGDASARTRRGPGFDPGGRAGRGRARRETLLSDGWRALPTPGHLRSDRARDGP